MTIALYGVSSLLASGRSAPVSLSRLVVRKLSCNAPTYETTRFPTLRNQLSFPVLVARRKFTFPPCIVPTYGNTVVRAVAVVFRNASLGFSALVETSA